MWYWLPKNTHKSWLYLASFIGIFHVLLLFVMFFMYRDGVSHLTFTITPALMRHPIEFRVAVETIKKQSGSSVLAPQKKDTRVPKVPQKQKQVTIAQPKKKLVQKKQIVPHKEQKPPAPKQIAVTPPKVDPVKKETVQQPPLPAVQEHVDMQIGANQSMQGFAQEYATLYHEIASCWSPPPGIPVGCACTITIMIDRQGIVTALEVTESSPMPIFDLAAQASLSEFQFPRMAWGKSITITFMV